MIFIDFQKAFDTLEWSYLYKCLEAFNFGDELICWVRTFYQNIQSCVINNGTASDYLNLERGVRKGDPLSPYLFILAVETMAIAIRENVEIKGIKLGEEETSSFNTQIGIVTSKCTLLNYLLLVGKLFLWECRRNKVLPNIYGFQTKVGIKYETEKFICTKNNKLHQFHRKWTIITL